MTITNRQPNCQPFKKNEKLKINKKNKNKYDFILKIIFQKVFFNFLFRKTYVEKIYTGNSQFLSQKSHVITDPLEGVGSVKYGL